MDLKFLFYIFLSIVLTSGGAFYYYNDRQPITAALVFFGFIAFSVVFGLRWFTASGQVVGAATGGWPPVINYCPDFLTLYEVNGKQACIDTIGVARQNGISRWSDPNQTADNYIFNLHLEKAGDARTKALCDECVAKKVTWEGVHDGSICLGNAPPMPPKHTSTATALGAIPRA